MLPLEPVKKNAIAQTSKVTGLGGLKCHKLSISGNYGVRRFAVLVIIEVGQPGKILPRSVEPQLPNVDVTGATHASKPLALTVGLDRGVESVRENASTSLYVPGALETFVA